MIKYGYLVVEGPHDVEFVGRFLELRDYQRKRNKSEVDHFWWPLLPIHFPLKDDLERRMPVPIFFQSATHSIAVHSAGGEPKVTKAARGRDGTKKRENLFEHRINS